MKFSIWDHMSRLESVALDLQYENRLQLLEQADRTDIHGYYLAEHHHTPLCMAPSQNIFLAAAAQRTKNLRLGSAIYIAPMYHPIRLLEEVAMLDRLSGGRFEAGFSAGAGGGYEVALWGQDPAENRGRFEAMLDVMVQGVTGEFVTHKSDYYDFDGLWMAVQPQQKPNLPLWYGGTPAKAGALGLRCFATHREIDELPALRKSYLDAWQKAQNDPSPYVLKGQAPVFATHRHVFIAPTDAEALERAREAYAVLGTRWARPLPSGELLDLDIDYARIDPRDLPWLPDFQQYLDLEKLIVGSPSTVRDYILRYAEEGADDHFLMSIQFGDVSHEEASRTLQLFTDEVRPAALARAA